MTPDKGMTPEELDWSATKPRSNWVMWVALAGLCAIALFSTRPRKSSIAWVDNWGNGMALALQTGRPVLVDFYGPGCTYCIQMDREVFSQSQVGKRLENWVTIKVDASAHPRTAAEYRVEAWPTFVVLTPTGEPIAQTVGAMEIDDFLAFLDQAEAKIKASRDVTTQPATPH